MEDIPGPKHIPRALTPTKMAEYVLYAQISTLIAKNFLVINLEPPNPTNILPITKNTNPGN